MTSCCRNRYPARRDMRVECRGRGREPMHHRGAKVAEKKRANSRHPWLASGTGGRSGVYSACHQHYRSNCVRLWRGEQPTSLVSDTGQGDQIRKANRRRCSPRTRQFREAGSEARAQGVGIRWGAHAFRHGNATLLDSLRAPMAVRQEWLGHVDAQNHHELHAPRDSRRCTRSEPTWGTPRQRILCPRFTQVVTRSRNGLRTHIGSRLDSSELWLRGADLNRRPLGYEPNELPGCSTPHCYLSNPSYPGQIQQHTTRAAVFDFRLAPNLHPLHSYLFFLQR